MCSRLFVVLLVLASLVTGGCSHPAAWRVPVAPPTGAPGARACVRTCDFYSDDARPECLSKCPGSVRLATCPSPKEPPAIAVCGEGSQRDAAAMPIVLGTLVVALLVVVTIVSNPDFCPGC